MSIYTSNEGELCCPLCGETNTHVDEASVAARPLGEDGPSIDIGLNRCGALTTRPLPASRDVGQGRRHRIALFGWCESCDGRFALLFTQHKGVTLVETIDLAEQANGQAA